MKYSCFKKFKKTTILNLIFSAIFISNLQAQQKDVNSYEEFTLGEIVVIGDKQPATKEVTKTTTITAEEMKEKNVKTVAEALNYVAGLRVSTDGKKRAKCHHSRN